MYVLGIVAPSETAVRPLAERLVERCSAHGRVATIERSTGEVFTGEESTGEMATSEGPVEEAATTARRTGDAAASYRLGDDGAWVATGVDRSLRETLDELAPAYDYAIVTGFDDLRLPHVAIGDVAAAETAILHAPSPDDVDLATVLEALHASEPYVTLETLVQRAKESTDAEKAGAIATFTGRVRAREHDDDVPTEYLEFEAYEGVAEDRLVAIRKELEARDGVYEVLMHHRTGVIEYGEDIVFVVVLAGHRAEAFRTVQDGINRLKAEVPIFKKEVTTAEEFWVHTRP